MVILVVGLFVYGPDRLPRLVEDIRAGIYAARSAIRDAKLTLNNDLGSEFDELKKPLQQLGSLRKMSPKAAISSMLFDEDADFLDSFDPKAIMSQETVGQAYREKSVQADGHSPAKHNPEVEQTKPATSGATTSSQTVSGEPAKPTSSWEDIN